MLNVGTGRRRRSGNRIRYWARLPCLVKCIQELCGGLKPQFPDLPVEKMILRRGFLFVVHSSAAGTGMHRLGHQEAGDSAWRGWISPLPRSTANATHPSPLLFRLVLTLLPSNSDKLEADGKQRRAVRANQKQPSGAKGQCKPNQFSVLECCSLRGRARV